MTLNLFALTDDASQRVLRIPLASGVQNEVTLMFRQQEVEFLSRSQTYIPFDGKYRPGPNECLFIDNFDDIDGLKAAIVNSANVPAVSPAAEILSTIKALFSGYVQNDGEVTVLIQIFEKRRIISTGGLLTLILDASHYKKFDTVGLTIDNKITTIIDGAKLKFFSFHVARQIFDLSQEYIEATDQDIQAFTALETVQVTNQTAFLSNSDTWVRRKIALIKQSGVLETVPIQNMKQIAAGFGVSLQTTQKSGLDAILLPDDKAELKKLLRFLDEDFYNSVLLAKPHLTNSKIPL